MRFIKCGINFQQCYISPTKILNIQILIIFNTLYFSVLNFCIEYHVFYHFLRNICKGLSGGDSTDCSCLILFLEFLRFEDNLFIGRGEILDSKF